MPSPERRAALEARFARWLAQDVTALLPSGPHPDLQDRLKGWLWTHFAFDWEAVQENVGGTAGHHSAFLHAKVQLGQAWLEGRPSAQTQEAEVTCLRALNAFWLEWAGYQLTVLSDPA
ncbi:hypothetical protein K7W42_08175 [Deinococcus sp. HMF7604]|uniref:hypothetical protein n=1 Tax=Deinococcus betulae TaxID=2873312 RepID=UPI001CCF6587|nr:hypothetical protein [Deinococcus betulae]MBZ9750838.1 hypothetical protein [Deinococcus betulae]